LKSTSSAGSGHPTSCLSAADMAAYLFTEHFQYDLKNPLNPNNDRFILSKGHASPLLYSLFGLSGAYPLTETLSLRKDNSAFEGHPTPRFPYADAATGSLGQGLSIGAGMAWLAKQQQRDFKTYVLLGDGELSEGQVWEAANFASFYCLDNLVALLDVNRLAQSGESMFGHRVEEYEKRFSAFGFETMIIDGHDFGQISEAFRKALNPSKGKPFAIVAKTIKGKGISFLEDKPDWHGKALNDEQLEKALAELDGLADETITIRSPAKIPDGTMPAPQNAQPLKTYDKGSSHATREVIGETLAAYGQHNHNLYVIDGDVKNSTYTMDFMQAFPERFIEGFIAEQNMVSVGVGLSRLGCIPVISTFGAFLTRAADQVRMARVSKANLKFVGTHVGVSIGEDGPSQMALEDIALFGAQPNTLIMQPAEATSAQKLCDVMLNHEGFVYMRALRPKTPVLYAQTEQFEPGGSKILRQSTEDYLVIAATGITVFEALNACDKLKEQGIPVRVIDCYSICPLDRETLINSLNDSVMRTLITVEDHYTHGGF
ncbi:MAG: transketolase, partial [Mucilaginibacter polytrichastri]|nr:transketolase [Mucilaginibacter polytrichastri]